MTDELDPLIHVPTRLKIVATLAALPDGDTLSFTRLQDLLGLTPGNLIIQLRKLEEEDPVFAQIGSARGYQEPPPSAIPATASTQAAGLYACLRMFMHHRRWAWSPASAADKAEPGVQRGTSPLPGAHLADRRSAYRQPSAGATWVRMLSMTWAL